ncbi:DNA/RNA non-specific endonuclease [Pedobacter sp.]|uniref:DNA/RNA non-specific endonuclease n=1 Tax=Pedobacter sp. TaxID=1411316 RepID=UPI003BA860F4
MNIFETIKQNDTALFTELRERLGGGYQLKKAGKFGIDNKTVMAVIEGSSATLESAAPVNPFLEAVIKDFYRPSLLILNNSFSIAEADEWKKRLEPYRSNIEQRIPSVGRIEFKFHPRLSWGGTGFLIEENIILTNRHVAAEFAMEKGKKFVFVKNDLGKQIEARIDFKEEYRKNQDEHNSREFEVAEVLFMEIPGNPDVAFLRLKKNSGLEPVPILAKKLTNGQVISTVGYPAFDGFRNPLSAVDAERIFGNIYDVKRLAPGNVMVADYDKNIFTHDCTSLGGNSGSLVLCVESGSVAGLHFGGVFHKENYAIQASTLLDYVSKKKLQISINKDGESKVAEVDKTVIEEFAAEGKPEDYQNRKGYVETFLGDKNVVKLPFITSEAGKKVYYQNKGKKDSVLRYEHFSVEMNQERRLCFYSAVNIFGALCRKTKRPGWAYDPRIDETLQIREECYGNSPKFSRGHMTRREDPAWGETAQAAHLGNADSMHVTNAIPQMQTFNAGIWLELENYALQNAKGDDMKISVFTGPVLEETDPVHFGIQIPIECWKIIVFIHEKTGKLCATGYIMSQKDFLMGQEFVYGAFKTYQTSITSIETKTSLKFDGLTKIDPFVGHESLVSELKSLDNIKFI